MFPECSSTSTRFADYGKAILSPLPLAARLIVKGDVITNSVRYLQRCEGFRSDVQARNTTEYSVNILNIQ
jgi:hypothetical protein